MNGKNKPYSELGKLLDALARSRDVRGPYNIALHLNSVTGQNVSGQAVSKYLYGKYVPKQAFIRAFADAFELTPQERSELAWVYVYGFLRLPAREEKLDAPPSRAPYSLTSYGDKSLNHLSATP